MKTEIWQLIIQIQIDIIEHITNNNNSEKYTSVFVYKRKEDEVWKRKKGILSVDSEKIQNLVYTIRGQQVMLDSDLAELYGYEVKRLNEQVGRNINRFPRDFMFQLTQDEAENLKSQNATSSWGGKRKLPYVFTEQGIYMLATVLRGELAEKQSIYIMRAFREMQRFIVNNTLMFERVRGVELKQLEYQKQSRRN